MRIYYFYLLINMQNKSERRVKYILNQVVVLPDGLGDISTFIDVTKLHQKYLEIINEEQFFEFKYELLLFVYCIEDKYQLIIEFLQKNNLIQRDDIGKKVHIITYSEKNIDWSEDLMVKNAFFEDLFLEHKRYAKKNENYYKQIQSISIINSISAPAEEEFYNLIAISKTFESNQYKCQQSPFSEVIAQESGPLISIRISEPGWQRNYDIMNNMVKEVSKNNSIELNPILNQNIGFDEQENGLIFNDMEPINQLDKLSILQHLHQKNQKWVNPLVEISCKQSLNEFLENSFIVPAYNKDINHLIYYINILADSELVKEKKQLVILSNLDVDTIITNAKYIENCSIEVVHKEAIFTLDNHQLQLEEQSPSINEKIDSIIPHTNRITKVKIVSNISLSPEDHEKLFDLSSGIAMCTGDGTFKMCLEKNLLPINELRIHKLYNFYHFIDKIKKHDKSNPDIINFLSLQLYKSILELDENKQFSELLENTKSFISMTKNIKIQELFSKSLNPVVLKEWSKILDTIKFYNNYANKVYLFIKKSIFMSELPVVFNKKSKKTVQFLLEHFSKEDRENLSSIFNQNSFYNKNKIVQFIENAFATNQPIDKNENIISNPQENILYGGIFKKKETHELPKLTVLQENYKQKSEKEIPSKETTLRRAAFKGDWKTVKHLVKNYETDVHSKSNNGFNSLDWAYKGKQVYTVNKLRQLTQTDSILEKILGKYVLCNETEWPDKDVALWRAAKKGYYDDVQFLIESYEANPNSIICNMTALEIARQENHKEVAEFIENAVKNKYMNNKK